MRTVRLSRRVCAVGAVALFAVVGKAQVLTWTAESDNWSNSIRWNPIGIPDTTSETAFLPPGLYTCWVNGSYSINGYEISTGGARLSILPGNTLRSNGNQVTINGELEVNTSATNAGTGLIFQNVNSTIFGSGVITLNANGANLDTAFTMANGTIVTIGQFGQITGRGRMYGAWINNGFIVPDGASDFVQLVDSSTNNATMSALNSAVLSLNTMTLSQGAAGVLIAQADGVVSIESSVVNGGGIQTSGGGVAVITGDSRFTNVAVSGDVDLPHSQILRANGTLTGGSFLVNTTGTNAGTGLYLDSSNTVVTNADILLNSNAANLDTANFQTLGVLGTLNTSLVHGTGNMYGAWLNNSTIQADVPGRILQIRDNSTNNFRVKAVNGGQLVLDTMTLTQNNADGVLLADGGTVTISSSVVSSGAVVAQSGGAVTIAGDSRLTNTTGSGPINIPHSQVLRTNGTINHGGVITVNTTGTNASTGMFVDSSNTTLTGDMTVVLNANAANLDTGYLIANGVTGTLGADVEVRGTGRMYGGWLIDGLVDADVAGRTLEITDSSTNRALVRGTNDGTLRLESMTLVQNGGTLEADGGTVTIGSSVVSGGTLLAENGGAFTIAGDSRLSNTSGSGPINIPHSQILRTNGTIGHNGEITVNTTGTNAGTGMLVDSSNTTLTGDMTVVLNSNAANLDTGYLNANGVTGTLGADVEVRGTGRMYGGWLIDGLVDADVAGRTLEITDGSTNRAVVRGTNGGTLRLETMTLTQTGGTLEADGGTVTIGSSVVSGGTLLAENGGAFTIAGDSRLSNTSGSGPINIPPSQILRTNGTISHNGVITVNTTGTNASTGMFVDSSNTTLAGGMDVRLNANSANFDTGYLLANGVLGTFTSDSGVSGSGNIHGTWNHNGFVSPGNPTVRVGTIRAMNTVTMSNSSRLQIDIGGLSTGQSDRFIGNGANSIVVNGTVEARLVNGFVPVVGDVIQIMSNATITGTFDAVVAYDTVGLAFKIIQTGNSVSLQVICPPDFNGDGFLNGDDFDEFVAAFEPGDIEADYNGDGFVTGDDFDAFVEAFNNGCV